MSSPSLSSSLHPPFRARSPAHVVLPPSVHRELRRKVTELSTDGFLSIPESLLARKLTSAASIELKSYRAVLQLIHTAEARRSRVSEEESDAFPSRSGSAFLHRIFDTYAVRSEVQEDCDLVGALERGVGLREVVFCRNSFFPLPPTRLRRLKQRLRASSLRLLDEPNAGGSSENSEALSFEVLHAVSGAELFATEMGVSYREGVSGGIVDYVVELRAFPQGVRVGVSVVRAMVPSVLGTPDMFGAGDGVLLLAKKLEGLHSATRKVVRTEKWSRQLLHVWAQTEGIADILQLAAQALPARLTREAIILCTVAKPLGVLEHVVFDNAADWDHTQKKKAEKKGEKGEEKGGKSERRGGRERNRGGRGRVWEEEMTERRGGEGVEEEAGGEEGMGVEEGEVAVDGGEEGEGEEGGEEVEEVEEEEEVEEREEVKRWRSKKSVSSVAVLRAGERIKLRRPLLPPRIQSPPILPSSSSSSSPPSALPTVAKLGGGDGLGVSVRRARSNGDGDREVGRWSWRGGRRGEEGGGGVGEGMGGALGTRLRRGRPVLRGFSAPEELQRIPTPSPVRASAERKEKLLAVESSGGGEGGGMGGGEWGSRSEGRRGVESRGGREKRGGGLRTGTSSSEEDGILRSQTNPFPVRSHALGGVGEVGSLEPISMLRRRSSDEIALGKGGRVEERHVLRLRRSYSSGVASDISTGEAYARFIEGLAHGDSSSEEEEEEEEEEGHGRERRRRRKGGEGDKGDGGFDDDDDDDDDVSTDSIPLTPLTPRTPGVDQWGGDIPPEVKKLLPTQKRPKMWVRRGLDRGLFTIRELIMAVEAVRNALSAPPRP